MLNSELEVLKFWNEQKIFEQTIEHRKNGEPFVFLDGPPFATGLPHWGHILVSQVKDSVLRYQTQKGKYVPRRWGWDCHGAPIEVLVEKELGIKDKRQIENEIGIGVFNQRCRDKVMIYDQEWRKVINRIGRWVDMDDQYRTMDNDFIESVWWGLGQLWQKGLLYKDYRISLYSPSVGVPLSHTDVAMEVEYQEEKLDTPIVRFKATEASSRKLTKKVLEEIAFSYSQQLRDKTDLEKKMGKFSNAERARRANFKDIMKSGHPEFDAVDWDNLRGIGNATDTSEQMNQLRKQYELVLENIDTLQHFKSILTKSQDLYLLSWTTTPWTFPANVALAVGEDIEYSIYYLGATGELVVLAENQAINVLSLQLHEAVVNSPQLQEELKNIEDSSEYFARIGVEIIKIVSFTGKDLEGLEYRPLFEPNQNIESYEQRANIYKVYTAPFADDQTGTGIVQIAPAYGGEDFELKQARNLPILTCLNEHGEMRDDLNPELKSVYNKNFLDANSIMNDILDKKGVLFAKIPFSHRVPVYSRDGKKVYYAAQEGWFIAETKLKTKSLELNEKINWHPESLKHGRFGKGLESAPDWSISRSRYWGNPMPIWQTADKSKTLFIDSIEKLQKYAINPIYRVINTRDLKPEIYENGKTVILTDSHSKLPLGINAIQYRSKNLTDLRREKSIDIIKFAEYGQKILDEILELFNKYQDVQVMLGDVESRLWTTWLWTLHPESKKTSKIFYFYKKVEEDLGNYHSTGPIKLLDLHRPFIDEIVLRDEVGNVYNRIADVMDCWVESGSMPFASWHYPFENKEFVNDNLPADWIMEAQDQTRGWFRTLHVLSTGIFNQEAFKNINCSGLIMASDGKKMSKSKKNYSDPGELVDKFGADALRNYLLSSGLLNAENVNFMDKDAETTFRETTLLLANSLQYLKYVFSLYPQLLPTRNYKHPLNKWWQAYTQEFALKVDTYMQNYQLTEASRLVIPFIRDLSTWYIRRSKDLLSEEYGSEIATCLRETMQIFAAASASLQPFNSERLWSLVRDSEDPISVHLTDYPDLGPLGEKQVALLDRMTKLRELVSQIHSARKDHHVRVRQPLYADFSKFRVEAGLLELLQKECNLLERDLSKTEGEIFESESDFGYLKVDLVVDTDLAVLGFKRDFERAVQDFRKKQGFKPGQIVTMQWSLMDIKDEIVLEKVLDQLDWNKLCLEVKWVKHLDPEANKSFAIRDLVTVVVQYA